MDPGTSQIYQDIYQLRFLSVDDLLILYFLAQKQMSVTKIAKKLRLSQPAITQRLRKMESAFIGKLVERSGRGIQLTQFGIEQSTKATAALVALQGSF